MQKSGFFNAVLNNGEYDRKYNANDYCDNLAVVISNGVLRAAGDNLAVTASGMGVTVGVGRAWINGHYYLNDTPFSMVAVQAPTVGARIDRVLLRLNKGLAVRSVSLVYEQGALSNNPVAPAPVREGDIYDLVLADVYVGTNATSVTVTDMRDNAELCGWVYSTKGDETFYNRLETAFNEWFAETKDTLASVTLFKRYNWRTVLENATNTVAFNIPQYDAGTCFIEVFVNGILSTQAIDYTLVNNALTFGGTLVVGTEIEVKCYKSIDGTGIMTMADEITELQNTVGALGTVGKFTYNCNGVDDNVKISQMAMDYINGGNDRGELTINVVGDFGATAPYSGDGTDSQPYTWFEIGTGTVTNRRVTLDFAGCNKVNLSLGNFVYYLFKGVQYTIKNLCANIEGEESLLYGQSFVFGSKNVYLSNCRIYANVRDGRLFSYGTFRDCEMMIKAKAEQTAVFRPILSSDTIRIYGGEYRAYVSGNYVAAVIYCPSDITSCVIIADGLNCPTRAESGYQQTHAVYDLATSNYHRYFNIISELLLHAPSQTIRDTLVLNK